MNTQIFSVTNCAHPLVKQPGSTQEAKVFSMTLPTLRKRGDS